MVSAILHDRTRTTGLNRQKKKKILTVMPSFFWKRSIFDLEFIHILAELTVLKVLFYFRVFFFLTF